MVKRRKHHPSKNLNASKQTQIKFLPSLKERLFNKKTIWFLVLILFAFSLNVLGREWGLSGYTTWQPDSIEGEMSINHLPLMFKQWQHKYPRGQFLMNWFFYNPLIKHWEKNPETFTNASGKTIQSAITVDRARCLASIARWIATAMSMGTIIAAFVLTKYLFGDYLAGWLAGLTLSVSCLFLFYSGIAHVDVPFAFWFAWACVFTVRAAKEHKLYQYILAGLFAAYAFCTKEGYFGYTPGLAIVYCILRILEQYRETSSLKKAVLSIFSFKTLAAITAFVVLFLIMNGCFNFIKEFSGRMEYWKNDATFHHKRPHLGLLKKAGLGLYTGLGWPLLIILVTGIIYFSFKYPRALAPALIPIVVFYLITVLRTRFVADRFFIPAYICFSVVIGKTLADWIRFKKIPIVIRYSTTGILMGLTIALCVGLKLEMNNDTRSQLESWFDEHVDKTVLIGSGMKRQYAPRLKYNGYRLIDGWHSEGISTSKGKVEIFPEYLVMSNMWPCMSNYKPDYDYKEKLYNGLAGYEQVATFEARYFPPAFSIASICCWPHRPVYFVSPTISVFKKNKVQMNRD